MVSIAGSKAVTTSGTSQVVSEPKMGRRVAFSITNYGATIAWVNMSDSETAGVGRGIPIYPGGVIADSNGDIYRCWQGSITAVDNGASGATTIAVWERVAL